MTCSQQHTTFVHFHRYKPNIILTTITVNFFIMRLPGTEAAREVTGKIGDTSGTGNKGSRFQTNEQRHTASDELVDERLASSNRFASGANMNSGNVITGRSSTRVAAPPGGISQITFG